MEEEQIYEREGVEVTDIVPAGSFQLVYDPKEAVIRGREVARLLRSIVEQAGWIYTIGTDARGKPIEGLLFPAWQTIGTWYGVIATIVELKEERDERGKLVRARARALPISMKTGQPIVPEEGGEWGIAERDEMIRDRKTGSWKRRWDENTPEHVIVMAACTRAKRRVLQNLFAPIVALAGYKVEEEEEEGTDVQVGAHSYPSFQAFFQGAINPFPQGLPRLGSGPLALSLIH
ncbi:MAG: hypothetical protein N2116_03560, partial [Armatimonadetes bacterium]|nr:hypothetical protein [Armatimonadota bacterium]